MCRFWRRLFGSKSTTEETPMKKFLVAGLGNIGPEYELTRHNIGFEVVSNFVESHEGKFESAKLGAIAKVRVKGRMLIILKPATYMNLSGKAIRYWLQKEKIPTENLLVITDDLNLPFGTIRLKTKGSDGGHNGLRDIQNQLGTTNYNRLRFGIGDEFQKGRQVDFVLSKWNENEISALKERLNMTDKVIESFVLAGVKETMNTYNGK